MRYVLEHRVLPGSEKASRGNRVTRHFTGFEAFGIAVAGWMLDAGLRRATAAACIAACVRGPSRPSELLCRMPLYQAYAATGRTMLSVGDTAHVRVRSDGGYQPFDTGWLDIATGALAVAYLPRVEVRIDVGTLPAPIRRLAGE